MCIVAHAAKAIQQCKRVNRRSHVPFIMKIFAHPGRQGEHRRDIARDKRLPAVKKRCVTGTLTWPQASERGLYTKIQQACDSSSHSRVECVMARARIAVPKTIAIQQSRAGTDAAIAYVLQQVCIAAAHASQMAAHSLVECVRSTPQCASSRQHQVEFWC